MSGGHFNHIQHSIENGLNDFGRDPEVKERLPKLSKALKGLALELGEILHDIDWDLSGDSSIDDDATFDREAIKRLTIRLGGK